MTEFAEQIARNYKSVQERIADAANRAGRQPRDITLIAVTKYADLEWVRVLVELGAAELGENYPQQLLDRQELISGNVHWHLIGSLQRNKARKILPAVSLIHSVDSVKLLITLERLAAELDLQPELLLEVNISGEGTKHGFTPDALREVWEQIGDCRCLRVSGLMTMAPHADDPEQARPVFAALRKLRDELNARSAAVPLRHLSMGMTGDFEVAIEEGATLVRIGSALWEGLDPREG